MSVKELRTKIKYEEFHSEMTRIKNYISSHLGYDISSKVRERKYYFARYAFIEWMKENYDLEIYNRKKDNKGWSSLARVLNLTHASIINALRNHEQLMKENNSEYIIIYTRIMSAIELYKKYNYGKISNTHLG